MRPGWADDTEAKWIERARGLAGEVSTWSSCTRDKVGAVVIDPKSWDVVAVGFNDTAPGLRNCVDGGCPRAARCPKPDSPMAPQDECLHAEDNALQRAGLGARGAWLVTSRRPCAGCTRRARVAGSLVLIWPDGWQRL